jgi:hypothetical protein
MVKSILDIYMYKKKKKRMSTNIFEDQTEYTLEELLEREQIEKVPKEEKEEKKEIQLSLENRRRYQAENMLDLILHLTSPYDLFTFDAFQILVCAKYISENMEKYSVSTEFLLPAFFLLDLPAVLPLRHFQVNENEINQMIAKLHKKKEKTHFLIKFFNKKKEFVLHYLTKFLKKSELLKELFIEPVIYDEDISEFSDEMEEFLVQCTINASERFKTPSVSPEILLITIIEEKNTTAGKMINSFFSSETHRQLLRYELIKMLHKQECALKNRLSSYNLLYGYLMKAHLSEKEFNKLLDSNLLDSAISVFRNTLISELVILDYLDLLSLRVNQSISRDRTYLT